MSARKPLVVLMMLVGVKVAACGSTTSDDVALSVTDPDGGDAATADARGNDARAEDARVIGDAKVRDDADGVDLSGDHACGAATCVSGEYCIHPCGGGALPQCIPANDAGGCPNGAVSGQCFAGSGGPTFGCVPAPPPPYCSKKPTCPNGTSSATGAGRDVGCLCA